MTINMAEKLRSFYTSHVPHQQNVHANALTFLATSFALPIGETEKVLVQICDLYCSKFTLEDVKPPKGNLQVKEVIETSIGSELMDW